MKTSKLIARSILMVADDSSLQQVKQELTDKLLFVDVALIKRNIIVAQIHHAKINTETTDNHLVIFTKLGKVIFAAEFMTDIKFVNGAWQFIYENVLKVYIHTRPKKVKGVSLEK